MTSADAACGYCAGQLCPLRYAYHCQGLDMPITIKGIYTQKNYHRDLMKILNSQTLSRCRRRRPFKINKMALRFQEVIKPRRLFSLWGYGGLTPFQTIFIINKNEIQHDG